MPVLARKGNYVLVSYVENRIIILNEDDEPRQLLPFHDGTIRSVDRDGKTKGEIALGVYHVKNADGEWRTLPKHQDLKALTREYGGDDYQDVY